MGVWGLDIYDDDLAVDIREEFRSLLDEDMEADEAIEAILLNNEDILDDNEDRGTFILTVGVLCKENEVNNKKVIRLLKNLKSDRYYWDYIKDDSIELYEARIDLLNDLL